MFCCSTCEKLFLVLFAGICVLLFLAAVAISSTGGILLWNFSLIVDPEDELASSKFDKHNQGVQSIQLMSLTQRLIGAFNQSLAICTFAGGFVLMIIAAFGFIGVVLKNRFLLIIFFLVKFIFLLAIISFLIMYVIDDTWLKDIVIRLFFDQLASHYQLQLSNSPFANKFTKFWDLYQIKMMCCGVYDWDDFEYTRDRNFNNKNQKVPLSCCQTTTNINMKLCVENPNENNSFIKYPCGTSIYKSVENTQTIILLITTLAGALCLFIITAVMGALWAVCHRIQSLGYIHEHHFAKERAKFHRKLLKVDSTNKI